ncbi:flavin-dependent L-tryptophan oxidase RebO precursor [Oxobacter pfennigii]|uniref:Flavin-dependent L-tryptophan oxidase RebO n=1 Tax=Oxobacter pfennigii TaxID=36849 RepID=A0A0P8W2N5_9CLOT|nr:NAD(P)/FAD-dependent oxidoreductase [Oxobacter pfennigii]KPU42772.1 flavin-dependent L-tryptophan oxidase RebO precursor [Oxobacter pfennigii]
MHSTPTNGPQPVPLPKNPTDEQRHKIIYNSLVEAGRPEDYENIVGLLRPPQDITRSISPGEFKAIKVGIIGGGLAGMAAAFELRKLGFDITVFEPITERVGGRIYTYYFDNGKKLYGELGAGRIPASHETVWHYINLFKLDTLPIISENSNSFIYVREVRVRADNKGQNVRHQIYPLFNLTVEETNTQWPELYDQVTKHYLSNLPPEVRKQLLMTLPRYDYRLEALQDISIRQAMQQYGLSLDAVNMITSVMPTVGALLDNSYAAELHSEYSLDYMNPYRISGGMLNLPLAFYNSLTSPNPSEYPGIPQDALGSVNWKGGFIVTGIFKSASNGKVAIRYMRTTVPEDIFEDFDYVLCAAPYPTLRPMDISPVFTPRKMQAIKQVYYQDAQRTLFLCRERFWERLGIYRGSSYTDEIIQMIIYPQDHALCSQSSPGCSPGEPGVLIASYNIGQDADSLGNFLPMEKYLYLRNKVEKVHGLPRWSLDFNKIVSGFKTINWSSEPYFFGAFQFFLPGQQRDFLYISTIPEYGNRVFFAGEHTSPKNGWLQGALQSGMIAAKDIAYYGIIHKYQR